MTICEYVYDADNIYHYCSERFNGLRWFRNEQINTATCVLKIIIHRAESEVVIGIDCLYMNRLLVFFLVALLSVSAAWAKGEDKLIPEYQIEGAGTGNMSVSLVNVTIVSKKKDFREHDFGRCAVHGILFRGYSDANAAYTSSSHPALMGSPMAEMQHADFFQSFFDSAYAGYVQVQSDTRRVIKVGKEYKTTVSVAVSVSQLRQDLEKAGLLKSLKTGW